VHNAKLLQAFDRTFSRMPDHAQTLLGQRKSGSKWADRFVSNTKEQLKNFLESFDFAYMEEQGDSKVKFYCVEEDHVGTIGIITLDYVWNQDQVRVIETAHGKCLGIELKNPLTEIVADEAWCIVGDEPEVGEIIFTMYPGPVTKKIPPEFLENRSVGSVVPNDLIHPDWAIKVIR